MKFMVLLLPLVLCLVRADSSDKQDVKTKMTSSTHNTIPPVKSHEVYYQNMLKYHQQQPLQQQQQIHQQQQQQHYQKPQYVPVQLIPRPYYVQPHHHHPQAMIIIAQPALVPQSLFYGAQQPAASPTQQLLNYFHSNPQAKYQLLHGNTQQLQQVQPHHQVQQVQPTFTHQVIAAPSYGNYILTAPPHYHQPNLVAQAAATVPVHTIPHSAAIAAQYQVQPQYQIQPQVQADVHPVHLTQHQVAQQQIAQQQIAQHQAAQQQAAQQQAAQQQAAQHQVAQQQHQQPQQLRSIAHLAQLAAQQFHSATAGQKSAPSAIVTGFEHFSPEQQAQIKAQLSNHLGANYHAVTAGNNNNQYSAKYQASEEQQAGGEQEEEFVPSPQVKTAMESVVVSGGSAAGGDILKTRYTTKGIRM